jgi:hypothetical protein
MEANMLGLRLGLAALMLAGASGLAAAQPATAPRDPNMPDPKNVPAEKIAPADPGATGSTGSTGGNLSQKLEQSEGVIKPPATGDSMQVPAPVPNPGTTPVIPPRGTSPSDPVQPK